MRFEVVGLRFGVVGLRFEVLGLRFKPHFFFHQSILCPRSTTPQARIAVTMSTTHNSNVMAEFRDHVVISSWMGSVTPAMQDMLRLTTSEGPACLGICQQRECDPGSRDRMSQADHRRGRPCCAWTYDVPLCRGRTRHRSAAPHRDRRAADQWWAAHWAARRRNKSRHAVHRPRSHQLAEARLTRSRCLHHVVTRLRRLHELAHDLLLASRTRDRLAKGTTLVSILERPQARHALPLYKRRRAQLLRTPKVSRAMATLLCT
eukprot:COSAG02_NODE_10005_length_2053_cov_1.644319_2_plen_261_part_00